MSDRTNFQLTIAACPPEHVADVLAWIDELGLGEEWGYASTGPVLTELKLGVQYAANEVRCGATGETVGRFCEIPGLAYECWEDPAYEWLGEVARRIDTLPGAWRQECDANGQAMFTAEEVRRCPLQPEQRELYLGDRHAERLAELLEQNKGVVLARPEEE